MYDEGSEIVTDCLHMNFTASPEKPLMGFPVITTFRCDDCGTLGHPQKGILLFISSEVAKGDDIYSFIDWAQE